MNLFFFGMGFSSLATARAIRNLVDHNAHIAGTTRSAEKLPILERAGIVPHIFTGSEPGETLSDDLSAATHLICSIAPNEAGDPALIHHRDALDAAQNLRWLGYFSTIGVYGNADGQWIDETAPLHPHNQRLRQRIAAEAAWRDYARQRGLPLAILRLAGIYGPGRSALDKLRDGTARRIIKPGQMFNRIHVGDIGRIAALAAQRELSGIFNLADDEPAPPQDLITFAARMLDIEPPPEIPFENAELSPMARSFYEGNRRVSNTAIKSALGIDLLYPDYRHGITAIYEAEAEAK